jgi:hypothetical protein
MKYFKFLLALFVLGFLLNCSKLTQKVEEKVNQKINEEIDEKLKEVDTNLSRQKLDSIMKSLDTLKTKADSLLQDAKEKTNKK